VLVRLCGLGDVDKVVLTDLGISKAVEDTGNVSNTKSAGTAGYIAPEVIRGEYDPLRADMYSFGVLALVILAGVEPLKLPKLKHSAELPFSLPESASERSKADDLWKFVAETVYAKCAQNDEDDRKSAEDIHTLLAEADEASRTDSASDDGSSV
jgi:serine/threonine protein kinase